MHGKNEIEKCYFFIHRECRFEKENRRREKTSWTKNKNEEKKKEK